MAASFCMSAVHPQDPVVALTAADVNADYWVGVALNDQLLLGGNGSCGCFLPMWTETGDWVRRSPDRIIRSPPQLEGCDR